MPDCSSFLILACEGSAQNNPAEPTQQPQQQQPAPAPVIQQPVADPEYHKASCDKPKDHEAADLCEQRRMAQAAEDAVWWARFQTLLGIFGFAAVLVSLIFTGWAAIAAGRAAKAAQKSVRVAEQTAERQLRAYIFIDECKMTNVAVGQLPIVRVRINNNCPTPAYDLVSTLHMGLGRYPPPKSWSPKLEPPDELSKMTLGPTGKFTASTSKAKAITQEEFSKLNANKAAIYVIGEINFVDAFKEKRFVKYRLMFTKRVLDLGDGVLEVCEEGNESN